MEIRQVIMTGDGFQGQIELDYEEQSEILIRYDQSNAIMSKSWHKFLIRNFPKTITELNNFSIAANAARPGSIVITDKEITFETFWQKYDNKLSSKKKTEAKWNKMSKAERLKAFNYIAKYFQSLPQGVAKKYATTYLNDELWNN